MHRVGTGRLAGLDDLVRQQIGLGGRRRTDVHRLVGHFHVQRAGIRIGVDRHRLDPQRLGTLDNATGNFAAIGDEDGIEHEAAPS
jgi:hypothetical protein